MKALEFMDILRDKFAIPWSTEGQDCSSTMGMASRSEVKRWLKMGAVEIDRVKVGMDTKLHFPILDVIFFPNGKARTTMGFFEMEGVGEDYV
jgi:hypothetical protein